MNVHPQIIATSLRLQIGHAEAEQVLRGSALSDPAAAKAVAEIDAERKARSDAARTRNEQAAAAMEMEPGEANHLVEILADCPQLLTWLSKRVHLRIAHGRPLRDDE